MVENEMLSGAGKSNRMSVVSERSNGVPRSRRCRLDAMIRGQSHPNIKLLVPKHRVLTVRLHHDQNRSQVEEVETQGREVAGEGSGWEFAVENKKIPY